MRIEITPFTEPMVPAVRAFNVRLANAAPDPNRYSSRFPESPVPAWLPPREGRPIWQEFYVARDEDGEVRGAYILKRQPVLVRGEVRELATYQLPISEGIIHPAYAVVGVRLLRDASRRCPWLWGLGGGLHNPIGRFLVAAGWKAHPVPFHFRIVHPGPFLRNIQALRTSMVLRTILDGLRVSGVGWAGISSITALRTTHRPAPGLQVETVPAFGPWADGLWERCSGAYSFASVRNLEVLDALYPPSHGRFTRLRVGRGQETLGWAVLLNTVMEGNKYFGDMKVGTLVDCLARPEDAADVITAARLELEAQGADLIVSNQASRKWCCGLRRNGFFEGTSNFPFLASKPVAGLLDPLEAFAPDFHLNRGDGDGPINL
jgi:hypothetical protein